MQNLLESERLIHSFINVEEWNVDVYENISTWSVNSFQKPSLKVATAERFIKSSNMLLKEFIIKSWSILKLLIKRSLVPRDP